MKSQDTVEVAKETKPYVEEIPIVSLQNGVRNTEGDILIDEAFEENNKRVEDISKILNKAGGKIVSIIFQDFQLKR